MSTYLIDFENVKSGGLAGIDHIRREDSVHLFWSARENKITIDMMEMIRSSESEIVMHKAVTGERDALDHQLCSYLGFLAGGRGETDFIIVSNDKAYDHLIEFWKKLDDRIHIQRVPEISRVSEAAGNTAESGGTAVEEVQTDAADTGVIRADKNQNEHPQQNERMESAERTVQDTFASRNSRRRERGSRYLKGGRTGRGSRKNNYTESYQEERPEEVKAADRVRETGMYQKEIQEVPEIQKTPEATELPEIQKTPEATELPEAQKTPEATEAPEAQKAPEVTEAPEIQKTPEAAEAPKAQKTPEVTETPESLQTPGASRAPERKKDSAAAYVVTGIRTGILVESGFTADGILKTGSEYSGNPGREKADEVSEKHEETSEASVKTAEKPEATVKETEKTAEGPVKTAGKPEEAAERPAETAGKPEKEAGTSAVNAEISAESVKNSAEKVEAPERNVDNAAEKADNVTEKTEKVTAASGDQEKDTGKEENASVETAEHAAEDAAPAADETVVEKKPRSRASRSAGRVKRGRPSQKEKTEYIPEIRIPIIEADVVAKCEEAAGAEWTGEVVRLINHSKDKKELYSAIVKLLGQEKGRNVYHAIKVLK